MWLCLQWSLMTSYVLSSSSSKVDEGVLYIYDQSNVFQLTIVHASWFPFTDVHSLTRNSLVFI